MRNAFIAGLFTLLSVSCGEPDRENKTTGLDSTITDQTGTGASKSVAEMSTLEKETLKETLMKQGLYDCCTRPGCTLCIGEKQECGCYLDIKKKDPICAECLEGYKSGRGKMKLMSIVDLEEIRAKKGSR